MIKKICSREHDFHKVMGVHHGTSANRGKPSGYASDKPKRAFPINSVLFRHTAQILLCFFVILGLVTEAGTLLQNNDYAATEKYKTVTETIRGKRNLYLDEGKIASTGMPLEKYYTNQSSYVSEITSTSTPFDAMAIDWSENIPEGTSLRLFIRFFQKGKWELWQRVDQDIDGPEDYDNIAIYDGANWKAERNAFIIVNRATKFQYRVDLESFDGSKTPVLEKIDFTSIYSPPLPQEKGVRKMVSGMKKLIAGLNVISDTSPKIFSRKEWGVDESLRIATNIEKKESSEASEDNPSEKTQLVNIEEDFYKNFEDELKITEVIDTNEAGEPLRWPIEKAEKIQKIIIHHTATTKDLDNPAAAIRSIYYYHAITRGWGDIGYNYIIDPEGNIYEGRAGGEKVVGAHAGKHNVGSIGIAVLGNYDYDEVPLKVVQGMVDLIAEKVKKYHIDPLGRSRFRGKNIPNIVGHRNVGATTCPGARLYDKIPDLRKIIAESISFLDNATGENSSTGETPEYDFEETASRGIVVLDPNKTEKITFSLKNTGTITWNNQTFLIANQNELNKGIIAFKRNPEKQSNIASMNESSVSPGQTATFTVEASSSLKHGLITFDMTPIFNDGKKLRKYMSVPMYVNPPKLSYSIYEISQPKTSLKAKEATSAWVKLQNTGDITWTNDGEYPIQLGTDNPRDRQSPMADFKTRIGFLKNKEVKPGEIGYFILDFKAPAIGGVFQEQFTPVIDGIGWMKSDKNLSFTFFVEGATYKAEMVSQSSSDVFKPGERKSEWIMLKNVGDAPWMTTGSKKMFIGQLKAKGIGLYKVKLEKETAPGERAKITFDIVAPEKEGRYTIYFWPRVKGKNMVKKPLPFRFRVTNKDVEATKSKDIRIALSFTGTPIITADGNFDLIVDDKVKKSFSAEDKIEIKYENGRYLVKKESETMMFASYPRFVPHEGFIMRIDNFTNRPSWSTNVNDNQYRGILEVRNIDGSLLVINELPLEDYMKGLAEPAENDPFEKIKAILIAARSYAYYYMTEGVKFPDMPYHGSDDPAIFQRYLGYGYEMRAPNTVKAIEETASMVVTYEGKVVKTPYFSSSDGRTRSAEEVFGWTHTPYLQSVDDPFCEGMELRGHGVGMSGCGAKGLAEAGKKAEEILKYYYQGVEIEKVF